MFIWERLEEEEMGEVNKFCFGLVKFEMSVIYLNGQTVRVWVWGILGIEI